MVLYAREDVAYVLVPVDNGGCGLPHRRPVVNGAPDKQFKLDCQLCENFLRADIARTGNKKVRTVNSDNGMKLAERYLGQWGASPETIPETPDQEKQREWNSDRTALENASTQTEAFGRIADALAGNQELILKLAEMMAGGQITAAQVAAAAQSAPVLTPAPAARVVESRDCMDCGKTITRLEGQKGALPWRCPDCKAKKRRKAA